MRMAVATQGHQRLLVVTSITQRARVIQLQLVPKTIPLVAALRAAVVVLREIFEPFLFADLFAPVLVEGHDHRMCI